MFRYSFKKHLKDLGISNNANILAAVSGGMDSMCMLDALLNCSLNLNISVAHVNFNLRGKESDSDTAMVTQYCQSNNIELFTTHFNTAQYAKQKNISIEMAARELRYNWFFQLMQQNNFEYLAIAHNSNDNAETLLLNLVRGTGIEGITGIKEIVKIPQSNKSIIRPLLVYSRYQIEKYAQKFNVPFRTDSTNNLSDYHRNRIRNEVFPQLKKINPSVIKTFNTDIKHFIQANRVLNNLIEEKTKQIAHIYNSFSSLESSSYAQQLCALNLTLNRYKTNNQPDMSHLICLINIADLVKEQEWEFYIYNILKGYNFSPDIIEDICCNINETIGGKAETKRFLSGRGNVAVKERGMLKIYRDIPSLKQEEKEFSENELLNNVITFNNLCFKSKIILTKECENLKKNKLVSFLDLEKISFPVKIHTVRDGEKFSPFGLRGSKKITDYLTDIKFENIHKNRVSILTDKDNNPLCIIGLQIDNRVKITDKTKKVLKIEVI